jgi:geranylgeranyl reductase family protein
MKYDIIVVGAGPAGTTAGRRCALQGLKTLILEKEKLPRYKPCGGAVSTVAMSLLDFKLKNELIERECYGARVHYEHYEIEVKKPFRLSILTSRDKFDMYLAEKAIDAGVELKDDESVKSLDVQDSYVAVKTDKHTYKTFAVIGADGVNSVVATYVRPKYKPTEVALAIEAPIPAKDKEIDNYIHDAIDIHFGLVRMGYGWLFPKRGHFSVGIAGLLSEIKNPRKVFENFLKKLGFDIESRPYTRYAHRIPAGGYDRETCSDRIILVGDAAGYVDTFYGEGIAYAILSAKIAAETMVTAYEKDEFSRRELAKYKQECDETFGENLKYALEFSSLAHKYPNIFIKLLASNKSILDKYLEVPAGNMSYKEFKKWLLIRTPYYAIKGVMHL